MSEAKRDELAELEALRELNLELAELLRESGYGTCKAGDDCSDPLCAKASALLAKIGERV